MSETWEVRFELADGSVRTVLVSAKGAVTAELRGRGELARSVPAEAYTAKLVKARVRPPADE